MKRIATILLLFLTASITLGQPPVAVNDTASGGLGQYVTVHVTENDYSPEGLDFRVYLAPDADSFTDSTITFYFEYDDYYNYSKKLFTSIYMIIDENGQIDESSQARIFVDLNNHDFYDTLDVGNIRASIYAYNNQFWTGPDNDAFNLFEYPKGSKKNTVFNCALWFGGVKQKGELYLAGERYRQIGLDYWTGPLSMDAASTSIDLETVVDWHRVWKLDTDEIIYHNQHWEEPGYEPIEEIKTWPAHGDPELNQAEYLAPFIDTDNDGIYEPYSGDYPLIRGDQCIYFIFNDQRIHTETGGKTIGLEIHGMAYEFNKPDEQAMYNTVFLSYKIFNRSGITLENTYVGLFSDFDIGYAFDDFVGCDVARGAFYGYNGKEIDGSGQDDAYGENPPAQGIVILGGPYIDPNGNDDPPGGCDESINGVGFGDGVVDNERYGMKKFLYFNNSAGVQGDPQVAEEYYQYMNGVWKDGTAMEYGGNGHVSSGAYGPACNFMFPGLSDPCYWGTKGEEPYGPVEWTEESAGNIPTDRRGLSVMGPFTLIPDVVHKVDLAFIAARGDNGPLSSVNLLKDYIDIVKNEYHKNSDDFGYQWLGSGKTIFEKNKLSVYPNPATNDLWINYDAQGRTVTFRINDLLGREVLAGKIKPGIRFNIPVGNLNKGVYVVTLVDGQKISTTKVMKN